MKQMKKIKEKAAKIAQTDGMSERDKIKSIQKLHKSTARGERTAPVYIVRKRHQSVAMGRKGPTGNKHSKVRIVDARMKKDKRATNNKKNGGSGGSKKRRKTHK